MTRSNLVFANFNFVVASILTCCPQIWFLLQPSRHFSGEFPCIVVDHCKAHFQSTKTGWWFQTFFIFHFIYGIISPSHWRTPSFFKMVFRPTTKQLIFPYVFFVPFSRWNHHGELRRRRTFWMCWCLAGGSGWEFHRVSQPHDRLIL